MACNIYNQGNAQMFRRGLVAQIGEKRVDMVEYKAKNESRKYSEFEYKELIEEYSQKVRELKKEKGVLKLFYHTFVF